MTVTDTTKITGDSGRDETSRKARRTYLVTYSPDELPKDTTDAETATGIPTIGTPYKSGSSRLAKSVEGRPLDGTGEAFVVEVAYTGPAGDTIVSPLSRPDTIRGSGNSESEEVFLTTDSVPKPIVNKAKEPFEPLAQRTTSSFGFVIEGNRSVADGPTLTAQMIEYLKPNAVNSDSVTIRGRTFAAGTLKMKNIGFTSEAENGVSYEKWTWEVEGAPTWDLKIENRGYKQLVGGKQYDILDSGTSTPVATPYPLNSDGTKKTNPDDVPDTLTFQIYPRKPFAVFGWTATV